MADEAQEPEALDQMSFQRSLEEIEGIVERIESEDVDIDELGEQLQRAASLLEVCRAKIRKAEVEVRHIVDKLDEGDLEEAD